MLDRISKKDLEILQKKSLDKIVMIRLTHEQHEFVKEKKLKIAEMVRRFIDNAMMEDK